MLQYCFHFMFWFFGYKASYSWTRDWNCNPCFGRWSSNPWITHSWRYFFWYFLHKLRCCDHCLLYRRQRSDHSCVGTWRLRPVFPYITTPHSSRIVLTVSVYYDKHTDVAYNWAKEDTIALRSSVVVWVPPVLTAHQAAEADGSAVSFPITSGLALLFPGPPCLPFGLYIFWFTPATGQNTSSNRESM